MRPSSSRPSSSRPASSSSRKDDKRSFELCDPQELKENEMKDFEITDDENNKYKILLVKYENQFYAVGSMCAHYAYPLSDGWTYNGRIRCKAHGACFNIKTGDIEDFPGIDCIPTYEVKWDKITNKISVRVSLNELKQNKLKEHKIVKVPKVTNMQPKQEICVIIGAGGSGAMCAEALREESYSGKIKILTKEPYYPYYRPKLSKMLDMEQSKIALGYPNSRDKEFYEKANIDFQINKEIISVDTVNKKLNCADDTIMSFDKLVIASGLESNSLDVEGRNLKGIFTIRSIDEANQASKYCSDFIDSNGSLNVVIIGSSFLAMESAHHFKKWGDDSNVTIYCKHKPFEKLFGEKVADQVCKLHESKKVKLVIENLSVKKFNADSNVVDRLGSIVFSDDRVVNANVCILAIGSKPATKFLNSSDIKLDADGYIEVNEFMQTNIDGVYAAGDITKFPALAIKGLADSKTPHDKINMQHWQIACVQGKVAGYHISGRVDKPLNYVPFFWSQNFDKVFRYAGYCDYYDEIVFHSKKDFEFVAFYLVGDRVVAVCSCNFDPICAAIAETFFNNITILKEHIVADPWGFKVLLK